MLYPALLVCMLIFGFVFMVVGHQKKKKSAHKITPITLLDDCNTETRIESSTSDCILSESVNDKSSIDNFVSMQEMAQSLKKHIHKLKNYEEMSFTPPTDNDKIVFLPVEGTYNRLFFTKMFMLRKHTVQNVIISDFDMIQYQIPVEVSNEELILLIYGRHIISERLLPKGKCIGNSLCDDVDSIVCSHSVALEQYRKLRRVFYTYCLANINANQETEENQVLEAMSDLEKWIKNNTKKAEEHYLLSEYRIIKWSSEYKLYSMVRFWYNDTVFQYTPEWLSGQSIDIYIPTRKIGIEYQGKQHFEPVDFFGGDAKFEDNILRDQRKALLCKENGIELRQWSYEKKLHFSDVTFFRNIDYSQAIDQLNEIKVFPVENLLYKPKKEHTNKVKTPTSIIRQYGIDGAFIGEYTSLQEAHICTGINISSIQKCISGNRRTAGSYIWRRERPDATIINPSIIIEDLNAGNTNKVSEKTGVSKAVIKIDAITGVIIRSYSSIAEAANDVGINRKGISDVLKGKQKTAGGFIWQYDFESISTSVLTKGEEKE